MALIHTPQRIELRYGPQQYWFNVWRFGTMQELHTALIKARVGDFANNTAAKTVFYDADSNKGDECGAMYLLDKSIATMTHHAALMAFHLGRRGNIENSFGYQEVIAALTGKITADLYSKSKFF